jgi:hypothetical protein
METMLPEARVSAVKNDGDARLVATIRRTAAALVP